MSFKLDAHRKRSAIHYEEFEQIIRKQEQRIRDKGY